MNLEWTMDIGGVRLGLIGPAEQLEPFAEAWSAWSGRDADWVVRFTPDPSLPLPAGPYFGARPRFKAEHCLLETVGFRGRILPTSREAELRYHPAADSGDIAYFIRTVFALAAFDQQKLLFHAAGIVHREKAYTFFGQSGSGKTTASRLSKGKPVLSDDLLLLSPDVNGIDVWATPFGRRRHPDHSVAPLRALLRLLQAPEDRVISMPPSEALAALVANSPVINADVARVPELMGWWSQILSRVPVYRLYFRKADTFWEVIDADIR